MIAYVAGPYRSKSKFGVFLNIMKARRVAKELWKMGYTVICPHSNTAFFDSAADENAFLKGGIKILKKCDILIVIPGWELSQGTIQEIKTAMNNSIPRLYWDDQKNLIEIVATKSVGKLLKHLRKELPRRDIAKNINVSYSTVRDNELDNVIPSQKTIREYCKVYSSPSCLYELLTVMARKMKNHTRKEV